MMTIQHILREAEMLSAEERRELIKSLVDTLAVVETQVSSQKTPTHRLAELRGLGKEIWEGIDVQDYVDQMRDPASSHTWEQVRQQHPNVWVLIEALDAYTDEAHGKRVIPHMRLIQAFGDDWHVAWGAYKEAHHADLDREYYILHTVRETLDIGVLDPFRRRLDTR